MRVCKVDPKHKNFIVTACETHAWLVDADGSYIDDKGCYESTVHADTSWSCSECGAQAVIVKTISELSEREAKEKLSELRALCLRLADAHRVYHYKLRDDLISELHQAAAQVYGE